ncbi:hypothetical protein GCM10023097_29430 [Streptomyces collinus]|uniref:Regulatory protein n=1 Tax=Streptomyces collinus TaxID=42684 RepID=A0AA89QRS4_STRCU|nr:hypothetical protein [Streptomyces collinus]
MSDELTISAVPASTAVTPGCDCYVHRFGSIAPGRRARCYPQAADAGRVGQHGLEIVMAVCRSIEIRREPVGKRIRAAIVLADDPGGDPAGRLL